MLDMLHIPRDKRGHFTEFTAPSTVHGTQWQTWRKPRGVSMVCIFAVGSGAGGGGGHTAAAGNARGGGGGGGSGATSRVLVPALLLPDVLYVQVGLGGAGGAATVAGGGGMRSLVSIYPHTSAFNCVCSGGSTPATGGGAGSGGGGGSIGNAQSATVAAEQPLSALGFGILDSMPGIAGSGGGAQTGANGTAISFTTNGPLTTGGTGGGGTTSGAFQGGLITAITGSWISEQRPEPSAAGSFNGSGGVQLWKPFFGFGGIGGSSSNTDVGGNGGSGAIGGGGGGGGGGTTGGRGGDGGHGYVLITCW